MRDQSMSHLRDQVQRRLEQAGVVILALGAGCLRLQGSHGSLVLTSDLLHLRTNEINKLMGGEA
jgi:hypothetical protein